MRLARNSHSPRAGPRAGPRADPDQKWDVHAVKQTPSETRSHAAVGRRNSERRTRRGNRTCWRADAAAAREAGGEDRVSGTDGCFARTSQSATPALGLPQLPASRPDDMDGQPRATGASARVPGAGWRLPDCSYKQRESGTKAGAVNTAPPISSAPLNG